jgi:hypothetical protein
VAAADVPRVGAVLSHNRRVRYPAMTASLGDVGDPRQINILTDPEAFCACVAGHTPKVVVFHEHHIVPISYGGPNTPENLVLLCPTGHATVHKLLAQYEKYDGTPPWAIRQLANPYLRAIAETGWNLIQTAF